MSMKGASVLTLERAREAMLRRKVLPDPIRRQEATQATLDKFRDLPFDWGTGRHCVRLAHYHLRQMGHRPPTLPRIRSALAAKRAMKERGWGSVREMLDSLLLPIVPAAMQAGDIGVVEGDEGFDSIVICLGPQKVLGWLPSGERMAIYDDGVKDLARAWRV